MYTDLMGDGRRLMGFFMSAPVMSRKQMPWCFVSGACPRAQTYGPLLWASCKAKTSSPPTAKAEVIQGGRMTASIMEEVALVQKLMKQKQAEMEQHKKKEREMHAKPPATKKVVVIASHNFVRIRKQPHKDNIYQNLDSNDDDAAAKEKFSIAAKQIARMNVNQHAGART
jgi:hypothetical protein